MEIVRGKNSNGQRLRRLVLLVVFSGAMLAAISSHHSSWWRIRNGVQPIKPYNQFQRTHKELRMLRFFARQDDIDDSSGYDESEAVPSSAAIDMPTSAPSTKIPTNSPSDAPSLAPSVSSAPSLSAAPSDSPSVSSRPSSTPTSSPTRICCTDSQLDDYIGRVRCNNEGFACCEVCFDQSSTGSPAMNMPSMGQPLAPSLRPTLQMSQPSSVPSVLPTVQMQQPSKAPSFVPTIQTTQPSNVPSTNPSVKTPQPSVAPSAMPSFQTAQPSNVPSEAPTLSPTLQTAQPSFLPSILPTMYPTNKPSLAPSWLPKTSDPTLGPTQRLTTLEPTLVPTRQPSSEPTRKPTLETTVSPSQEPTWLERQVPFPTTISELDDLPSAAPTPCIGNLTVVEEQYYVFFEEFDTSIVADIFLENAFRYAYNNNSGILDCEAEVLSVVRLPDPTERRLQGYTDLLLYTERIEFNVVSTQVNYTGLFPNPVIRGVFVAALNDYFIARQLPIYALAVKDSPGPSEAPSWAPNASSTAPTFAPSALLPTIAPSKSQTSEAPTNLPRSPTTPAPAPQGTTPPTFLPTGFPTAQPTTHPTEKPTLDPTFQPTFKPTMEPTTQPTTRPTAEPTPKPTFEPTLEPTFKPSSMPTSQPTAKSALPGPTRRTMAPTFNDPFPAPTTEPPTMNPTRFMTKAPDSQPRFTIQPTINLAPVTPLPTYSPTERPFALPSVSPSRFPSSSPPSLPSTAPSRLQSTLPSASSSPLRTASPSLVPPTLPSFSPTRAPDGMPSTLPTRSSYAPTETQGVIPSHSPSDFPDPGPTFSPNSSPLIAPSALSRKTLPPTIEPSSQPSQPPDYKLRESELNSVKMILTGVSLLSSRSQLVWTEATENAVQDEVVTTLNNQVESVDVRVSILSQNPQLSTSRILQGASLNSTTVITSNLTIVFDVNFSIRAVIEDHNVRRYAGAAFDTAADQATFIAQLKSSGETAFQNLTSVRLILPAEDSTGTLVEADDESGGLGDGMTVGVVEADDDSGTLGAGMTVGIAAVTIAGVSLIIVGVYMWAKQRHDQSQTSSEQVIGNLCEFEENDMTFNVVEKPETDVSTLGDPIPQGVAAAPMDVSLAEETTSLPYDYQVASHKLPSLDESASYSFTDASSNVADVQTDDDTLDAQYFIEDRIEVEAPPGMLGLILEANSEGVATVYDMKENSPLADRVHMGDKLVMVDDVDVTIIPVDSVMELMASKQANDVRRLVFSRPSKKFLSDEGTKS